MAVTKIWDVKGSAKVLVDYVSNPEKTVQYLSDEKLTDLEEVINYADDVRKTEEHFYTTALNCSKKNAAKDFNRIKEEFGKTGGIVCYHAYQSFDKGEGTPEQVHEIGVKLAKELWGDRFQVVVATHLNTDCLQSDIFKGKLGTFPLKKEARLNDKYYRSLFFNGFAHHLIASRRKEEVDVRQ